MIVCAKLLRLKFIHDMSNSDIYKERVPRRTSRHLIRDVEYEVSEWGDSKQPMLFWLHGWGDCSATFQFVVDQFSADWFVVAPDFRGFGGSKTDRASFWFPDYLADLDRLVDIYSPGEPVRLVGHSMGANVAGLFAGALPERVGAFINVEGFGLSNTNPDEAPVRYRRWIEEGRSDINFSTYADFSALADRVMKRSPRMTRARAEFVARSWARECDGRVVLRANPQHKLPNPVLYRRAESEACWRSVKAPVLLIAGSKSVFANATDSRLDTGSLALPFPNARTEVIEDSGHMLHFEAPEALAAAIESFFS